MKIVVAGASGRVGSALTEILAMRGNTVYAGSRNPERIKKAENIIPVTLDLHSDVDTLAIALRGMDCVCCAAGSRGKDLLQTDAFGVVKLIEAAEAAAVRRFVLLSSLYALEPRKWEEIESLRDILNYDIAKFFADSWLVRNSDLEYTIIQPTVLTEDTPAGTIRVNPRDLRPNAIGDVAQVMADVIERPNTYRKVILMSGGPVPIPEALDAV